MQRFLNRIICGDCLDVMREMPDESVDLLVTDPPYGLKFMGKDWDKAVPSVEIWKECLRVLKAGAFAFIMCSPRQDCLSRMIVNLQDAGFEMGFTSIYHAYGSGFPKSQNVSKAIDKRECIKQLTEKLGRKPTVEEVVEAWKDFRPVIGQRPDAALLNKSIQDASCGWHTARREERLLASVTIEAKALDGSYGGFQPKPAVEVILVCMKPLSEKTFVDQALKNRKGCTWLDDCRVPYGSETDKYSVPQSDFSVAKEGEINKIAIKTHGRKTYRSGNQCLSSPQGRFPANLLVSGDVLNDGRVRVSRWSGVAKDSSGDRWDKGWHGSPKSSMRSNDFVGDSGSFSRYFDLDKWAQRTFPFLIVPKASRSEKQRGCEELYWEKDKSLVGYHQIDRERWEWLAEEEARIYKETGKRISLKAEGNIHPTVKPIKLSAYLITLGSRKGDVVLDPFVGTGTTPIAAVELDRDYTAIDTEPEYVEIANCRLKAAAPFSIRKPQKPPKSSQTRTLNN